MLKHYKPELSAIVRRQSRARSGLSVRHSQVDRWLLWMRKLARVSIRMGDNGVEKEKGVVVAQSPHVYGVYGARRGFRAQQDS